MVRREKIDAQRMREVRALRIEQRQIFRQIQQAERVMGLWRAADDERRRRIRDTYASLEAQATARADALAAEIAEIEAAIDGLEAIERVILRAYYLDGERMDEVCRLVGYERAQVSRIRSRALAKLAAADQESRE